MNFTASELAIPGVVLISARRFADDRGSFMETYRARAFETLGVAARFVQDNQAFSSAAGTIRGLHFQKPPFAQAKLVRVLAGAIFDVAVDIRRGSPTFGQWVGARLAAGGDQLFVPAGFAHGYCTLEPNSEVFYRCDSYYAADAEGGIHFADPALAIAWPVAADSVVASERDRALPRLADITSPFAMEPA
jgi:dTDP-4-dehydrorhamnose 3,5-epimerase